MSCRFEKVSNSLWRLKDICNVYLLVKGNRGVLIDSGSGEIQRYLDLAGVAHIDWVLHTHHHRDQCAGTPELQKFGARVAVPEYDRHLFFPSR